MVGVLAWVGAVFFGSLAVAVPVTLATGSGSGKPLGVAFGAGFGAVWLTFAWRLYRTAMVWSATGVRVQWLLRTRTVPWSEVDHFETGPDVLVNARLWIVLADGTKIRTPVQCVTSRRNGSLVSDGGTWLAPDDYAKLLEVCRVRVTNAA